jgi:hypothetical protein
VVFNTCVFFPGNALKTFGREKSKEREKTRAQREIEKRSDDDRWRLVVSRSFLRVRVVVVVVVVVFNVVCGTPIGFIFWKRPRRDDGVEDAGDEEPVGEQRE